MPRFQFCVNCYISKWASARSAEETCTDGAFPPLVWCVRLLAENLPSVWLAVRWEDEESFLPIIRLPLWELDQNRILELSGKLGLLVEVLFAWRQFVKPSDGSACYLCRNMRAGLPARSDFVIIAAYENCARKPIPLGMGVCQRKNTKWEATKIPNETPQKSRLYWKPDFSGFQY